jgi:hypothetical protein
MDEKNKVSDAALEDAAGGRAMLIVSTGRSKVKTWTCTECGAKMYSDAEWKAHSQATGHTIHHEAYED